MLKILQCFVLGFALVASSTSFAQAPFHGKCVLLIEGLGVEFGNAFDSEPAVAILRKELGEVSGNTLLEVQVQCASSTDHFLNDPKVGFFERYARASTDGLSSLTAKVVSSMTLDKKRPHLVLSYTELKEEPQSENKQELNVSSNEF